jgi:putative hydrolase of the HAD superfamily
VGVRASTLRFVARAVLFDLFNTLVPGVVGSPPVLGPVLGVDADAFDRAFAACAHRRFAGELGDLTATLRAVAADVGASPSDVAVARAASLRLASTRQLLAAVPASTLTALGGLRSLGWRLGLVSNVTPGSATEWRSSALPPFFDAVAFSDEVHVAKPEPGIYLAACRSLDVPPSSCVYVGDGADSELEGAAALGMRVIRTVEHSAVERGWTGETIRSMPELLDLVGTPIPVRSDH